MCRGDGQRRELGQCGGRGEIGEGEECKERGGKY